MPHGHLMVTRHHLQADLEIVYKIINNQPEFNLQKINFSTNTHYIYIIQSSVNQLSSFKWGLSQYF